MITKSGMKDRTATFIISTEDVDRDNDIIKQEGWQLDNFWKNPILQVGHDSSKFPVGTFTNIYTSDGVTYGTARFADKGTSEVADLAYDLIQQDILRSVSVGFRGKGESNDYGGVTYNEAELLEVSLVNIPANQNAQVVAKAYSEETKDIIFKDYETTTGYVHIEGSNTNAGYVTTTSSTSTGPFITIKAVAIAEEEPEDEPAEAVAAEPEAEVGDDISDDTLDYIQEILNG